MKVELIINGNGYLLTYTLPSGNMVEVRCATPQLAVEYITDLNYKENKKVRQKTTLTPPAGERWKVQSTPARVGSQNFGTSGIETHREGNTEKLCKTMDYILLQTRKSTSD